ncbi:MAG: right-handed parallel beta-helix repeat-containing protein [Candidatus Eisenbacteria bacterium]
MLLADGVYAGADNKNVTVVNSRLTIMSESGDPELCVIDCEGSGRFAIYAGVSDSSASGLVQGLKITGASTAIEASEDVSLSINNCILTGNSGPAVRASGMPAQDYARINVSRSTFSSNPAGAMSCGYKCGLTAGSCTFFNNGRILFVDEQGYGSLLRCTVAFNSVSSGGLIVSSYSGVIINKSIIAFNSGNIIEYVGWCDVALECSDVYGNTAGDYVGCLAGRNGIDGNISSDPLFCDVATGTFTVEECSPCLPGNHPDSVDCDLIGAWDVGCVCGPSATESSTWGGIKSLYR